MLNRPVLGGLSGLRDQRPRPPLLPRDCPLLPCPEGPPRGRLIDGVCCVMEGAVGMFGGLGRQKWDGCNW